MPSDLPERGPPEVAKEGEDSAEHPRRSNSTSPVGGLGAVPIDYEVLRGGTPLYSWPGTDHSSGVQEILPGREGNTQMEPIEDSGDHALEYVIVRHKAQYFYARRDATFPNQYNIIIECEEQEARIIAEKANHGVPRNGPKHVPTEGS